MNNEKIRIDRIRKANELKNKASVSDSYKLSYFPGGNLVLLRKYKGCWILEDETGMWFDNIFDKVYEQ